MSLTTEIQQFQDESREGWMPEKGVDPAAEIMTDEQMRIAIAEACGWSEIDSYIGQEKMPEGLLKGQNPKYKGGKKEELPDYLNDLNSMHEAEEYIKDWPKWVKMLAKVIAGVPNATRAGGTKVFVDRSILARATARQRAEAFLKTKGILP